MQDAKNLKDYRCELREALENDFLRTAMDKFATAYPVGRANAFAELDIKEVVDAVVESKDAALTHLDELYQEFKRNAEAAGVTVHLAADAAEANRIIGEIAQRADCKKIVKSKSMTAEETLLNHHLEDLGLEVTETDLGEWIIQMRHEGPTHMVMPAIHLSRDQVADLFSDVTGKTQTNDIQKLVKVARRELRQKYIEADMGISGLNFAIAESGTLGIVTNEGNARLVTTLPRVHVALAGLDKLTPSLNDALKVLRVLPRNATGQAITSYVTWITGANECLAAPDNKKEIHVVFLDNGRRKMAADPLFSQVLRCVRCGACANVCPVYRMVGGHKMGHIYIGAIGLILTYFFHGSDKAKNLVQNCINCQACKNICAAGIDLPRLIKEIYARIQDTDGHGVQGTLMGYVMRNRSVFHSLLKAGRFAQKPFAKGTPYLRHLPMMFAKDQAFRALPAVADKAFRDIWPTVAPKVDNPTIRVGLFAGCAQDFLYPEQLVAGLRTFEGHGVSVDFPEKQSCCGLPLQMMGEKKAAEDVARQNVEAFDLNKVDYIVTLCASCASQLKHSYEKLLGDKPGLRVKAKIFSEKVIDYSSFMKDVLKVDASNFRDTGRKTTYHAPCHLCRGLDVHDAPRDLIRDSGMSYAPCQEEEVCCGFGGSFSVKFPEVSAGILKNKLDNIEDTGASQIVTDCPGCVMQIRGGMVNRGGKVEVRHIAEALVDQLK